MQIELEHNKNLSVQVLSILAVALCLVAAGVWGWLLREKFREKLLVAAEISSAPSRLAPVAEKAAASPAPPTDIPLPLAHTVVAQPKAVVAQPKAMVAQPKAVVAQPKAVVAQPKAVVAQPKAVVAQRKAVVAQPKAVVAQSKAVVAQSKAPPAPILEKPTVYQYNALSSDLVITTAPRGVVLLSRDAAGRRPYLRGHADAHGHFVVKNPPLGMLYWKEKSSAAAPHAVLVQGPDEAQVSLISPPVLAVTSALVWGSGHPVEFYKIIASQDENFATSQTFSTTGFSLPAAVLGVGRWYLEILAFNAERGAFDSSGVLAVDINAADAPEATLP